MNQLRGHSENINKIVTFLIGFPLIKLWKKHFKMISTQIYFTADGIKFGYLWDAGSRIDSATLNKLLSELVKLELIPDTLEVFEFSIEIFILNQTKLNKLIRDDTLKNIPLVDVSIALDKPQLLVKCNEIIVNIGKLIKVILDKNNLVEKLQHGVCVPTVTGVLIGYPVVYWYNPEISDENNLNNSRLKVFQLSYNDSLVYSFSVPYDLINQNNNLNQSVKFWLDEKSLHGFQIDSFITDTGIVIL